MRPGANKYFVRLIQPIMRHKNIAILCGTLHVPHLELFCARAMRLHDLAEVGLEGPEHLEMRDAKAWKLLVLPREWMCALALPSAVFECLRDRLVGPAPVLYTMTMSASAGLQSVHDARNYMFMSDQFEFRCLMRQEEMSVLLVDLSSGVSRAAGSRPGREYPGRTHSAQLHSIINLP